MKNQNLHLCQPPILKTAGYGPKKSPIVSAGFQRGKKYTRRSEKIEAVIVLEDHVRGMARNEVPACLLGSSTELVCLCDVSILRVSDLILWPMTTPWHAITILPNCGSYSGPRFTFISSIFDFDV